MEKATHFRNISSLGKEGLLPFVVFEAREAFKGNVCGCC
jgi:hypothetical protein